MKMQIDFLDISIIIVNVVGYRALNKPRYLECKEELNFYKCLLLLLRLRLYFL